MWIKAAIEHKVLEIDYFSARTRQQRTNREVEPDFVGTSRDGRNTGFFVTFCHLRNQGPRCFIPTTINGIKTTDKTFSPSPYGRWQELLDEYNKRELKNKKWGNL